MAGADGREPVGAIALAEVQCYTWRGLRECARLAAEQWDDQAWAGTLRGLAEGQHYYHPMSYHNGSVWPHDSMLAAEAMAAYGLTDQARTVAAGIREAAAQFGNSLPELFGGFSRADFLCAGCVLSHGFAAGLGCGRVPGRCPPDQ